MGDTGQQRLDGVSCETNRHWGPTRSCDRLRGMGVPPFTARNPVARGDINARGSRWRGITATRPISEKDLSKNRARKLFSKSSGVGFHAVWVRTHAVGVFLGPHEMKPPGWFACSLASP